MNRIGTASITTLFLPMLLHAQQPRVTPQVSGPDPTTNSFRFMAEHYGPWLQQAFDSIPGDKYAYRPMPAQQSIGYIAQHLEGANYALCDRFGPAKHVETAKDSLDDTVKAAWPKDTLVRRLRASFAFCRTALAQLSDAKLDVRVPFGAAAAGFTALPSRSLLLFVTDLAEHYSQLSVYMRLIGMIPPSALPPAPRVAITLPASTLAQYVGKYDLPSSILQDSPAFVLDVLVKDGAFYLQPAGRPARRLWPETPTEFFSREIDVQVSFTVDARGAVTGLVLHQSGEDRPAKRLPQ